MTGAEEDVANWADDEEEEEEEEAEEDEDVGLFCCIE